MWCTCDYNSYPKTPTTTILLSNRSGTLLGFSRYSMSMTRALLPKNTIYFTTKVEEPLLVAVQLLRERKSDNKRQQWMSIRFCNWIITGQSAMAEWLQEQFSKCQKAIEINYTTLNWLLWLDSRSLASFTLFSKPPCLFLSFLLSVKVPWFCFCIF